MDENSVLSKVMKQAEELVKRGHGESVAIAFEVKAGFELLEEMAQYAATKNWRHGHCDACSYNLEAIEELKGSVRDLFDRMEKLQGASPDQIRAMVLERTEPAEWVQ